MILLLMAALPAASVAQSQSRTASGVTQRSSCGIRQGQVTRERIRQIEARALRKLRHPGRSRQLRAFVAINQREQNDTLPDGRLNSGGHEQSRTA